MVTVEALKAHQYWQRSRAAGEVYQMREQDFAIMRSFGYVREAEGVRLPGAKSRRRYKRRDQVAQAVCALVAVLALIPAQALAQAPTVAVTWTAPTERVDGTPLAAGDIGAYILGCRASGSTGELVDLLELPGNTTEAEITRRDLFPTWGTYTCGLAARTVTGVRSDWSNLVDIDHPEAAPLPPVITLTIR